MTGPRIGSVCSGYRGLDMAVEAVFGGTTAWVSDVDPGANRILAHHWPTTPNLGDLTATDWQAVVDEHGRPDIVLGGYPCQPFSTAGKRKGTEDERHIWPYIADALGVLRPRVAIFENVAGHLRLGFDTVLADLARLGFDAEWCLVRASEVGAPHRRERLFILATAADASHLGHERGRDTRRRGHGPADHSHAPADTHRAELARESEEQPRGTAAAGDRRPAADAERIIPGHDRELPAGRNALRHGVRDDAPRCGAAPAAESVCCTCGCAEWKHDADGFCAGPCGGTCTDPELGRSTDADTTRQRHGNPWPASLGGLAPAAVSGGAAPHADADTRGRGADERDVRPGQPDADWGRFAPAVHRWEAVTGRRAPWATDDRNRLSPAFVEWLMGLPAGHVTAVPDLTRTQQLKALGNGVVPQQAKAAIRLLHERAVAA